MLKRVNAASLIPVRARANKISRIVAADVRRLITPNPKSEIDESLLTSAATDLKSGMIFHLSQSSFNLKVHS